MSHTPGPWVTSEFNEDWHASISIVRVDDDDPDIAEEVCQTFSETNAHLIAAAPDMLAMLEILAALIDGDVQYDSSPIRRVIAKAKGIE